MDPTLTNSYRRLQRGQVTTAKWNARDVECPQCRKLMNASSLGHHLADIHDVYQQRVVAKE
jgi:hypothetical protein